MPFKPAITRRGKMANRFPESYEQGDATQVYVVLVRFPTVGKRTIGATISRTSTDGGD